MSERMPFTSRRGFVTSTGFGILSLYGLWAGFGAAPLPSFGLGHDEGHGALPEAGYGGHGGAHGPSAEEFRREVEAYAKRHGLADGSVRPGSGEDDHGGHGGAHAEAEPVDVPFMAFQWGFEPSFLRLDRDVPYRFRMMAIDATHGASIQLGPASRIIRLRRGVLSEQTMTFRRAGDYLVYCTVYCGVAHDRMHGRIAVA
jgi:heme/copper-type cytochrome/quinol oxidase subunit 2